MNCCHAEPISSIGDEIKRLTVSIEFESPGFLKEMHEANLEWQKHCLQNQFNLHKKGCLGDHLEINHEENEAMLKDFTKKVKKIGEKYN